MRMQVLSAVLIVTMCFAWNASASEKKISRADLPPEVARAFTEQSKGAIVKGFSQENERGQVYYEAEMKVDGHSKDVLVDSAGRVVEIEEQVAIDLLSAQVRAGLQHKAGSGKLITVESLTKSNKVVAYEAIVETNGKKREIQVGPSGENLAHNE